MNRFHQTDWNDLALFLSLDESWVESTENVRLEFNSLAKHSGGPVLLPCEDWEGGRGGRQRAVQQDPFMASIVRDLEDDRYLLWYNTANRLVGWVSDPGMGNAPPVLSAGGGSRCCFASSADGLHWEKPDLGLVPYFGSTRNNMLALPGPPLLSDHLSGILPTRHEGATAALVGTVFSQFADPIYPSGITQLFSNDGLRWDLHYPPTLPLDGDAHCLSWDAGTSSYLLTTRSAQHVRIYNRLRAAGIKLPDKRHVAIARSRDLLHWTPLLDVLEADESDPENAQFYLMYILPYGNLYIGFLQVFLMGKTMSDGPLETQLAVSRDLVHWTRAAGRRPFIANDGPGSWDGAHTTLTACPPFLEGDRLRFWYSGKNTDHWQAGEAGLGTGTIRRDGFACWHAEGEGSVTSGPLSIRWASWPELNIEAPEGAVWLEVLDEEGRPLPGLSRSECVPMTGDEVRQTCCFKSPRGSFMRHTGRIRLRFHLKNARLYSFRVPNVSH